MRGVPLDALASAAITAASASRGEAPAWLTPAIPLIIVGSWIVLTTLIGFLVGHVKLLRLFPPVPERVAQQFRFASGSMRGASFNNGLYVGIGARGLHLAPIAIARPIFHRGIPCIPWHELRLVRAQRDGLIGTFTGSAFEIPSAKLKFTLFGKAGVAVAERLAMTGGRPSSEAQVQPPRTNRMMRE